MYRKIFFAVFSILLFTGPVFAHDMWLEKKDGKLVVVWGHADKIDPYDPAKVKEVKTFDLSGKEIAVSITKEKDSVVITPDKNTSVITVFFDSGFWTKTTDGFKNVSKKGIEEVIESFHSIKFSKTLLRWSDKFSNPFGMKFEIVPLKNPLSLKVGDTLPVKVFYEGKSLEGAVIYGGGYHKEKVKTDRDGMANIIIEKFGNQKIGAVHKIPFKDNPDVDYLVGTTNITFEVKQ